ncbi:MAG: 50S ribosomal protein L10 [Lachnospiraceae bacterium]|nr:50S ribosomal protein L10 [Lachnospiraceae bacterium]
MASANQSIKDAKAAIVAEISEQIKDAGSIVVVDYRGLTVAQDTALRKAFREEGVTYKVYKNTFITSAIKGTAFESIGEYLEGPTAIAIGRADATAPARVLGKFVKEADKLEIKGGVVEGTLYDAKGITAIAAIPSRDELLSKLLGSLQSPITNFARVMNQLAEKGGASATANEAPVEAKEEAPAEEAKAEAPAEAPVEEAKAEAEATTEA